MLNLKPRSSRVGKTIDIKKVDKTIDLKQDSRRKKLKYLASALVVWFLIGAYFILPEVLSLSYSTENPIQQNTKNSTNSGLVNTPIGISQIDVEEEEVFIATHIKTPEAVKAIYMTQCVAGTPSFRKDLVKIADETEINSIIIDIKDYTGSLVFRSNKELLKENGGGGCRSIDIREFIESLHKKGIYVIGRITVFQDPFYTSLRPDLAIKLFSSKTTVWKDYKGLSFIDAGAEDFWEYIVAVSKESYAIGFDELNFDYIRFPSDGNMQDIYYPFSEEKILADPDFGKAKVVRNFFAYLHDNLKDTGAILSADLFGMTTTNGDDLNIGQVLEYAEPYFDYIAPMVYPSHYPKGFLGFENPNNHIYEVVNYSMRKGVEKMLNASSSPLKLRPWLQDFDYGGDYGPVEVRAQIQATYDAGLTSWMLWSPSNRYTLDALEKE